MKLDKKNVVIAAALSGMVFGLALPANAQLFGRRVYRSYRPRTTSISNCAPCARAATMWQSYQPSAEYFQGAGSCNYDAWEEWKTAQTCAPCQSIQSYEEEAASTPSPCEAAQIYQHAETAQSYGETQTPPSPCGAATIYSQESATTCEYLPTDNGNIAVSSRPCPLRAIGETVASIPRNVAQRVSAAVMLAQVNALRARYGRAALTLDVALTQGAEAHCANEAQAGRIYHAPGCGYEITAQNWDAEGIETALNQWLTSSVGHRDLLLAAGFTKCGIAYRRAADGRNYCTIRFK